MDSSACVDGDYQRALLATQSAARALRFGAGGDLASLCTALKLAADCGSGDGGGAYCRRLLSLASPSFDVTSAAGAVRDQHVLALHTLLSAGDCIDDAGTEALRARLLRASEAVLAVGDGGGDDAASRGGGSLFNAQVLTFSARFDVAERRQRAFAAAACVALPHGDGAAAATLYANLAQRCRALFSASRDAFEAMLAFATYDGAGGADDDVDGLHRAARAYVALGEARADALAAVFAADAAADRANLTMLMRSADSILSTFKPVAAPPPSMVDEPPAKKNNKKKKSSKKRAAVAAVDDDDVAAKRTRSSGIVVGDVEDVPISNDADDDAVEFEHVEDDDVPQPPPAPRKPVEPIEDDDDDDDANGIGALYWQQPAPAPPAAAAPAAAAVADVVGEHVCLSPAQSLRVVADYCEQLEQQVLALQRENRDLREEIKAVRGHRRMARRAGGSGAT
jgi:hypothetical protein